MAPGVAVSALGAFLVTFHLLCLPVDVVLGDRCTKRKVITRSRL